MLISRTFAFVNNSVSKNLGIAKTMLTATENLIQTNNSQTQFGGNGVTLASGASQAQSIWVSITNTTRIIKELSFMRIQPSDTGKNNKHTAEIESLNSNADDMIEFKANSREINYTNLIMN
ncbi:MAG: hypothetical protein LBF97_01895 [Elusimicrobiota bacterium]|nr:hypothetical protein [Elusimicrobiota bacterium]